MYRFYRFLREAISETIAVIAMILLITLGLYIALMMLNFGVMFSTLISIVIMLFIIVLYY